ncbi:TlpA family protein disulfide reductase [Pseudemcibacter aquimaris]|uniref:TlpA family protein disulfide reductase n=1 Tax=Pseudemcibacter aquimaris TaxID=2857064 RepID=UPI0020117768|nr:TlpA disulfide reductase family protein [Pseudemcibacter aquimaris]MCC3861624.1 TlpA family protein disulfide reductase [Pseudemcibacter aquimaris]WDU58394.1 TlpA family protein disulfide reductase [Pseudemcibacter aquimaris]
MKNKAIYILSAVALLIGAYSFYDLGNTPSASIPQGLNAGAMKRFVFNEQVMPATTAKFQDEHGAEMTFADFKGKVILVNLWATWCAPCIKEMPDLNGLQESLGGDNFEVVLISENQDGIESSLKFLEDHNINHLKTYIDPGRKVARTLKSSALPTSLLIDANGNEIGRLVGPAEWNSGDAKALINYYITKSKS